MSDDGRLREIEARHRERLNALKNAPPLEKARTFLRTFCAGPQGLDEIQEQIQHALNFNAIPLYTGLEGLETVLADPTLPPETLVSLVKEDANQHRAPASPEEARRFLGNIVAILRRELGIGDEAFEGVVFFSPGDVFKLEDAESHVQPLRCVAMLQVDGEDHALFVPESAADDDGPYTVYRYTATPEPSMTYERISDPALAAQVIQAYRALEASDSD